MTYAFSFDARFCSGCKACQAACKDKNNLPTGVLWRRVIEVSGGEWQQEGDVWNNTVFAYNLSISCNHCTHPKCAGVCPTKAYTQREDGIIFLDSTKCVGCGYCAWACPYSAPQYDASTGHMTKCDSCLDYLAQGLPPACVAACPLRVLEHGNEESLIKGIALWKTLPELHPYPLSRFSHTQPRLAITPHPGMLSPEKRRVANREEIQPRRASTWEELPLLFFTLLTQLAVGSFWAMTWMFPLLWLLVEHDTTSLRLLPSAVIGVSLGAGMLASFAHLGTRKNAWRVFANLRKSCLSREILFLSLFAVSWLFATFEIVIRYQIQYEAIAITAILGVGLIYSMSQVYRLPAVRSWNSWRTNASFFLSALLLGISSMATLLAYESSLTGVQIPSSQWLLMGSINIILLMAELAILFTMHVQSPLAWVRVAAILVAMIISGLGLYSSHLNMSWVQAVLFLLLVIEESLGRWMFYMSRLSEAQVYFR